MRRFENAVAVIVENDPRFSSKAYFFLREALDYTVGRIMHQMECEPRHVSGQELLSGFRDFAMEQFGPMSATVMREWGLKNGYNVGEMVYQLIDAGIFSQQKGDSLNDFKGFMSFSEAFEKPFEPFSK